MSSVVCHESVSRSVPGGDCCGLVVPAVVQPHRLWFVFTSWPHRWQGQAEVVAGHGSQLRKRLSLAFLGCRTGCDGRGNSLTQVNSDSLLDLGRDRNSFVQRASDYLQLCRRWNNQTRDCVVVFHHHDRLALMICFSSPACRQLRSVVLCNHSNMLVRSSAVLWRNW